MPIDKIMKSVNDNPALKGALGGAAGGALVTAMMGNKTARKVAKTGGLMALGGLAWQAYRSYQESGAKMAPGTPEFQEDSFNLTPEDQPEEIHLVVRAMIAASHADGQLDDNERHRIWEHALAAGFSTTQLESLAQEIDEPVGFAQLAVSAQGMDQKIEVYTASRLMIDSGHEQGEAYLKSLAEALGLPRGLVMALNNESSKPSAEGQGVAA